MKFCQKNNCNNESIPQGKFCEIHRSIKKDINQYDVEKIKKDTELQSYLEEERKLKNEQYIEYQNTLEQDRKRFEELEYENILKLSLEQFYIDKKTNLEIEPKDGDFYSIKIKTYGFPY